MKVNRSKFVILVLYVDDILLDINVILLDINAISMLDDLKNFCLII